MINGENTKCPRANKASVDFQKWLRRRGWRSSGGTCGDGDQPPPPPPSSIQKVNQPNLYLLLNPLGSNGSIMIHLSFIYINSQTSCFFCIIHAWRKPCNHTSRCVHCQIMYFLITWIRWNQTSTSLSRLVTKWCSLNPRTAARSTGWTKVLQDSGFKTTMWTR